MTKIPKVMTYGMFLPMIGISLKGENSIGPIPSIALVNGFEDGMYSQGHKERDRGMPPLAKLRTGR
jgi:hypothetical protein